MKLEVITPTGPVCELDVVSVTVPAIDGELGILKDHAPMLAAMGNGEVRFVTESNQNQKISVEGGFLQVLDNQVQILAESAESLD